MSDDPENTSNAAARKARLQAQRRAAYQQAKAAREDVPGYQAMKAAAKTKRRADYDAQKQRQAVQRQQDKADLQARQRAEQTRQRHAHDQALWEKIQQQSAAIKKQWQQETATDKDTSNDTK